MELFVERLNLNALLLDRGLMLSGYTAVTLLPSVIAFLRHSNRHVEVGDLVGVLARSRNLDRSSPVEIEVAERVGQ